MWANYGQVRLQHTDGCKRTRNGTRPRIVQLGTTPSSSTPRWWADQTRGDKIRLLFSRIEIGNCALAGRPGVRILELHENETFVGHHLDVRSTLVPFTAKTISDFQKKTSKLWFTKLSFMDFVKFHGARDIFGS